MRRGIDSSVGRVSEKLSKLAKEVETKEQIAATAPIWAGETAIGEMIAEAMDKVGMEGVITVEESNTFGPGARAHGGMRFDNGYITADSSSILSGPRSCSRLVNEAVLPLPWKMVSR